MLKLEFLDKLKNTRNLLGFSGGVDSVGLFFALKEYGVSFDIAIIDYGVRQSSKQEVLYAQELAYRYQKKCFVLETSRIESNFEAKAREVRYDFFKKLIDEHKYPHLILAHHLNDRLEWFLMQLSKGCGLNTLLGFEGVEARDGYEIIRPLIHTPKEDIYKYCKSYKFFEDSTNTDMGYKRNNFRLKYANDLISNYGFGIAKSFEYLSADKSLLYPKIDFSRFGGVIYFERSFELRDFYYIDKILKSMGYVLSAAQRKEMIKADFSLEIGCKYIVASNQNYIFVSKIYNQDVILPKKFKNIARMHKIPKKIRPEIYIYLIEKRLDFEDMEEYLRKIFIKYQ